MLGPSIDRRDALEDAYIEVDGVPFIASETFTDQYGTSFEIRYEEGRLQVFATAAC